MADKSAIEWTDASWTPIRARNLKTGKIGWHCEHATTGCEFCYAEGMNKRLGTGLPFKPGHRKDLEIFLDEKMLIAPMRWRKPRMIFVCSMTDLFADFVKDEWIDQIFATMALCSNHTFQVLTKRADRFKSYMERWFMRLAENDRIFPHPAGLTKTHAMFDWCTLPRVLPNVWLGVSCERQQEADERIPLLLQTPAAVRFISAEPLLGPMHLVNIPSSRGGVLTVDWVICGGESGPNARPMHPDWARGLRRACETWKIPFFFKQWGGWLPVECEADGTFEYSGELRFLSPDGKSVGYEDIRRCDFSNESRLMERVGKKKAGRLLDGKEHNEFPQPAARGSPVASIKDQEQKLSVST